MAFGFIKNLFGAQIEDSSSSSKKYTEIASAFHRIMQEVFSSEVLGHIQAESFNGGVLTVRCSYDYMLELNERTDFFIERLNQMVKGMPVKSVEFVQS